jgi:hypothetical protein
MADMLADYFCRFKKTPSEHPAYAADEHATQQELTQ